MKTKCVLNVCIFTILSSSKTVRYARRSLTCSLKVIMVSWSHLSKWLHHRILQASTVITTTVLCLCACVSALACRTICPIRAVIGPYQFHEVLFEECDTWCCYMLFHFSVRWDSSVRVEPLGNISAVWSPGRAWGLGTRPRILSSFMHIGAFSWSW